MWARALTTGGALAQDPAAEAAALLAALSETGLHALELEYRLSRPLLECLLPALRPRGFTVVSLHNPVPLPPGLPRQRASGDVFSLASLDADQRRRAVDCALATLELASDLEAGAVVLHLGLVEALADQEVTPAAAQEGGLSGALRALLQKRAALAPRHLDAVSFSLERLARRAGPLGLRLGLENRFHAFQIPDFSEMGLLLSRFQGAPLGLWYDCGHAWVQGLAGLAPAAAWLRAYGATLVGCHLHDSRQADDHLAPGQGSLDWPALAQALLDAPLKVLEVAGGDLGHLRAGAALLEELFAAAGRAREKEAQR